VRDAVVVCVDDPEQLAVALELSVALEDAVTLALVLTDADAD